MRIKKFQSIRLLSYTLLTVFSLSLHAAAAERINSKESMRLCKNAMEADKPAALQYKFKRKSATSVSAESYKHYINYVEISEDDRSSKKLMCETSRSGEIIELRIEDGVWKM